MFCWNQKFCIKRVAFVTVQEALLWTSVDLHLPKYQCESPPSPHTHKNVSHWDSSVLSKLANCLRQFNKYLHSGDLSVCSTQSCTRNRASIVNHICQSGKSSDCPGSCASGLSAFYSFRPLCPRSRVYDSIL